MIEKMQIRKNRLDTRMITLTASLTALYVIPRTIILDRLIGVSGAITFSGIITPVLGVFLVPSYGIFAVFLGTMIAAFIPGSAGTLKFGGLGIASGEVYKPEAVIVPNVVFGSPGGNPFTVQSTAELLLPLTTAVNCCCTPPIFSGIEFGVQG